MAHASLRPAVAALCPWDGPQRSGAISGGVVGLTPRRPCAWEGARERVEPNVTYANGSGALPCRRRRRKEAEWAV